MATQNDPNALLSNLAELQISGATGDSLAAPPSKHSDTLFGPNIGIVSGGPAWTDAVRGKQPPVDELTVDVVKGWIDKSKQTTQATTTLQALVNLKRPTLRLTPLQPTEDKEASQPVQQHALEFEYDADAPRCALSLSVVLAPPHPDAPGTDGPTSVLVFETTTDGGFGRRLTLDDGAALELVRYETRPPVAAPEPGPVSPAAEPAAPVRPPAGGPDRRSKRFSFHLRRRPTSRAVAAGPALAVVDAETAAPTPDAAATATSDDHGVRVTIRLAALDASGVELGNAQTTYLHVVRFGAAPAAPAEDVRPWVVRVVKREAAIGPHVFHLHEIYGLAAPSAHAVPPPAPPPTSYPPVPASPAVQPEEEAGAECLLCLSAPREVVLLPCRHLVACKECALNMIEFGAGGTIQQSEDAPAEGTAGANETQVQEDAAVVAAAAAAPTPTASRRKRKAKGWFCPVCREPYTSMLRITTTPPAPEAEESKAEPAAAPTTSDDAPATGPLGGIGRPGFLRGLSLSSRNQAAASAPADVERGI